MIAVGSTDYPSCRYNFGHVVGILDVTFWDTSGKFSKTFASALTSPDESIVYKAINNIWVA
jgi:hypothetical protein